LELPTIFNSDLISSITYFFNENKSCVLTTASSLLATIGLTSVLAGCELNYTLDFLGAASCLDEVTLTGVSLILY
jgi:hypothetical protein